MDRFGYGQIYKMKKYRWNSPIDAFIGELQEKAACEIALKWCEKIRGLSFGEGMQKFFEDLEAEQAWAVYVLLVFRKRLSSSLRKYLIDKIQDPMQALWLYAKDLGIFTNKEKRTLKAKFEGKLPRAEKEIKEKNIKLPDGF